jgi:hypothetical protein
VNCILNQITVSLVQFYLYDSLITAPQQCECVCHHTSRLWCEEGTAGGRGGGGVSHISGSWRLDLYPESMEWFIEDLAFSPSYDLAPPVCRRSSLLTRKRRGWGSRGGSKSYDGEKVWSSINHSILSEPNIPTYTSSGYPFPHVRYA